MAHRFPAVWLLAAAVLALAALSLAHQPLMIDPDEPLTLNVLRKGMGVFFSDVSATRARVQPLFLCRRTRAVP